MLCFSLILLFRVTDEIFNFLLVWYYCTLTIRESILMSNGSRSVCHPLSLVTIFKTIAWICTIWRVVAAHGFNFFLFSSSDLNRIKGWWVSHHYVSTFLSGVMLTWWVSAFRTKLFLLMTVEDTNGFFYFISSLFFSSLFFFSNVSLQARGADVPEVQKSVSCILYLSK